MKIVKKVNNSVQGFWQKLKGSFNKYFVVASIIELVYFVLLFIAVGVYFYLIAPLITMMRNANLLISDLQEKGFTPLLQVEIAEVVGAKNKLIMYTIILLLFLLVYSTIEKGFLWQILNKKKFEIKKYLQILLMNVILSVVFGLLFLIGNFLIRDEFVIVYVFILVWLFFAYKNVLQLSISKGNKIKFAKISKIVFSPGLLLLPLAILILFVGTVNQVVILTVPSRVPAALTILVLLAIYLGWTKSFVMQYVK